MWPEGRSDQTGAEFDQNWLVTGLKENESNPSSPNEITGSDRRSNMKDIPEDLLKSGLFTEVLQVKSSDSQRHLLSENNAGTQVESARSNYESADSMTSRIDSINKTDLPSSDEGRDLKNFEFKQQSPVVLRNVNEVLMQSQKTRSTQRSSQSSGIRTSSIKKKERKKYKRYKGMNLEVDQNQYTLKSLWEVKDSNSR